MLRVMHDRANMDGSVERNKLNRYHGPRVDYQSQFGNTLNTGDVQWLGNEDSRYLWF